VAVSRRVAPIHRESPHGAAFWQVAKVAGEGASLGGLVGRDVVALSGRWEL